MDEKDKYILELEEKIQALEIKNTRLEVEQLEKNKRGAGAKPVPYEIINEIYDKYCKGVKVEALSKEYNIHKGTIYRRFGQLNTNKRKRSYSKEEIDRATGELIYVVDIISEATYEAGSPVPKNYEELISFYDKRVCDIDLSKIIRRVSQRYERLEIFLREEKIYFKEPLDKLFNL